MFIQDQTLGDFQAATGIDEVGRGCLAGPVVVAAVTWKPHEVARTPWFSLLADSKELDPVRRAALFPEILAGAMRVRVAVVNHMVIDTLNILQASLHGFCLVAPPYDPEIPLFVDGPHAPKTLPWAQPLVKGDQRMSAVAAASVVAKVYRDGLLHHLADTEPVYGFTHHKGYGTAAHLRALAEHGPGLFHRKSFKPVAAYLPEPGEAEALWSQRIQSARESDLPALFTAFSAAYPLLSVVGARQLVQHFQRRGLRLLPSARDFES